MTVLTLDKKSFSKEVLENKGIVIVDFWAPWCGPCQIMGPILEEFAKKMTGKVAVGKVNIDKAESLANKYSIMSIPAIFIFQNGKLVKQLIGIQSQEILEAEVRPFLEK